ncbi:MAG TPA: hypothetical protein VGA99_08660 [bacterium]
MSAKSQRKIRSSVPLPYSPVNYWLFGAAVVTLLAGYWALAQPPVDGFITMTVAPILLVIGYCVLIPLAIIFTKKKQATEQK